MNGFLPFLLFLLSLLVMVVRTKYVDAMKRASEGQSAHIFVELDDVLAWEQQQSKSLAQNDVFGELGQKTLCHRIIANGYRYVQLFASVIDELMASQSQLDGKQPFALGENEGDEVDPVTLMALQREARLREQRAEQEAQMASLPTAMSAAVKKDTGMTGLPPLLLRRYGLSFVPLTSTTNQYYHLGGSGLSLSSMLPVLSVRQVRSAMVGQLIRLRGIITRVSEVKPLLTVATYTCEACATEVYQEINGVAVFMPVLECPSPQCRSQNIKGQLTLQTRGSRFVKLQEGRLQEQQDQVQIGHIPRSMVVQWCGELTRQCSPGDAVILTGIFMPRPYTGIKAIKAGLLTDTYLLVQHVEPIKTAAKLQAHLEDTVEREMSKLLSSPDNAYTWLSSSIHPKSTVTWTSKKPCCYWSSGVSH